jgi:hypothetical protein
VCSDPDIVLQPEFIFKGKGVRVQLNPPPDVKFQWSPKGSYRLENMLETIKNLPNRYNIFSAKNYAIYVLDDYSVHIMDEIKNALLQKGYILVVIGGGVTGDIQINDTDLHAPLKAKYRKVEMKTMIRQLLNEPDKIPQPSRNEMMLMLCESFNEVLNDIDFSKRFKSLWVTNKLNGSEDYLVSSKLMDMVGDDLKEFRKNLMSKPSPKKIKAKSYNTTKRCSSEEFVCG